MWTVEYLREALEDIKKLDHGQRAQVVKAMQKVSINPLPYTEGGYGKPLGTNLTGFCKIKLRGSGLRVVYQVVREDKLMRIIVVSARADDTVYLIAQKRLGKEKH